MRAGRFAVGARRTSRPLPDHGIGANWTSDILEAPLAQIGKLDHDFAENLIVRRRRDADTTRFGDALKAGCDIDAVAKDVMGFDDYVADIYAYAKGETLVFSVANREVMDAFLPPRPRSEILPGARRQCFLRPGHHAARSRALQRPSGACSNARALSPRHCALDANSRRHRRPISPTTCVRPYLWAVAPWHANLFAPQLYDKIRCRAKKGS